MSERTDRALEGIHSDATVRLMAMSSVAWLVVAITLGLLQALQFIAPDFLAGIPWLVLPRIRQAHVNGLVFGFLSMAMIAGWYYVVPRLTRVGIWSEWLGIAVGWLWNAVLAAGVVGLLLGYTQAREYAELAWPIDIGIEVALLLTALNLFMTVARRRVNHIYVSLWYIMGSLVWFPIVYAIGNVIWAPPAGALTGLNDAIWAWSYGHDLFGLWLTTGTVALIYYVVPKEIRKPVYGYLLSLIGFWLLAFLFAAVGADHILQAPVPEWLKTIAVISSVGLLIPVLAFAVNIFMTMRGSWRALLYSIPLRFVVAGAVCFVAVGLQGSAQALRGFNEYVHFTDWTVAHAHLALLGFAGLTCMGALYYVLPRAAAKPLHSERLARLHFWLTAVGLLGMFGALASAGLAQAASASQGIPLIQVLPGIRPLWIARAVFGAMIVVGQYVFAYNLFWTMNGEIAPAEETPPELAAAGPPAADAAPVATAPVTPAPATEGQGVTS